MKITFYTAPARYARMNQYSIVLDGIIFIGAMGSGYNPWIQGRIHGHSEPSLNPDGSRWFRDSRSLGA
jgi:hypothetical protein